MLNIIIGDNASGKTVCLTEQLECSSKKGLTLTNMDVVENPSNVLYSDERLKILYQLSGEEPVTYDNERLVFKDGLKWSKGFMENITLLMKDCSAIFIDEPEFRLSGFECGMFATIVFALAAVVPEIWLTTHAVEFMGSESESVQYFKAVPDRDEFNLIKIAAEESYEGLY